MTIILTIPTVDGKGEFLLSLSKKNLLDILNQQEKVDAAHAVKPRIFPFLIDHNLDLKIQSSSSTLDGLDLDDAKLYYNTRSKRFMIQNHSIFSVEFAF
ncbi:hypothetical protein N0614_09580 [Pseudomonas aeruginosa]|nr:hypothetical protein [Pseudomonas aeruginosa]